MVTLYDVNIGDATLKVLEKSNNYHETFFEENNINNNNNWYKLNENEIN